MITAAHIAELSQVSGNFWTTYLDATSQAAFRRMRDTVAAAAIDGEIHAIAASYDGQTAVVGPRLIPFPIQHVVRVGQALNNFRNFGDKVIDQFDGAVTPPLEVESGAAVGRPAVDPNSSPQGLSYLTPIPANCVPLILMGKRVLFAGVDFRVIGGAIETAEAPQNLFYPEGIVVWREEHLRRNPAGYSFASDGLKMTAVARYYRYSQTPTAFLRAACEAAGLWEVEEDCVILARGETCYVTDTGRIPIRYKHAYHEVGETLTKGQFIGAAPEFTDLMHPFFSNGLPLKYLTPFDVTIPAGVIRVDVDTQALLPFVTGESGEVTRYWNFLRNSQSAWGVSPAAALGLDDASVNYIDWLALINTELLGTGVWVVDLKCQDLDARIDLRLRHWMRQNRPLGRAILFASDAPDAQLIVDYNGYLTTTLETEGLEADEDDTSGEFPIDSPSFTIGGFDVTFPDGNTVHLVGGVPLLIPFTFSNPDPGAPTPAPADFTPMFLHNIFALTHTK